MSTALKQLADYCFRQGLPSTTFMRTIHLHDDCSVTLNYPNRDCYTPSDEPELLALIKEMGYIHTIFGFSMAQKTN